MNTTTLAAIWGADDIKEIRYDPNGEIDFWTFSVRGVKAILFETEPPCAAVYRQRPYAHYNTLTFPKRTDTTDWEEIRKFVMREVNAEKFVDVPEQTS